MSKKIPVLPLAFAVSLYLAVGAQATDMLAAQNGMTLYSFDKDTKGVSNCYDACAVAWPPYAAMKDDKVAKDWSMVTRKDGTLQWAYDDKPLYFFNGDKAKGDKTGDGIKGIWHVVAE